MTCDDLSASRGPSCGVGKRACGQWLARTGRNARKDRTRQDVLVGGKSCRVARRRWVAAHTARFPAGPEQAPRPTRHRGRWPAIAPPPWRLYLLKSPR
jgi:hypothetical protein